MEGTAIFRSARLALGSRGIGAALALFAASFLVWCYYRGLSGPFLFDDAPNLSALALIGGDITWEHLKAYLNAGVAGPTGRPLSLLSFLINGSDWPPSSAYAFKYTNVLLHAANGILIFWLSLLLIQRVKGESAMATAVAALLAMVWALNPYHVSTVLYVVQRMAMLSASFVLLGLIIYVKGRILLESKSSEKAGLVLVIAAYVVGAGLGVLSKENAALFVLMVPLVEWVFFATSDRPLRAKFKRPLWLIIGLPAVLFVLAMAIQWPSLADEYRWFREFTIGERLLTQARALGYYLWRYLIPGEDYIGLYGDGFGKSTSFLEPASTLFWTLVHLALVFVAVKLRKVMPLLAFGVLFFYMAHLMESSIVPLEIFFEHRNYLPSAFLLLPLAAIPISRVLVAGLGVFALISAVFLKAEVLTWSEGTLFLETQVERNPNSVRAVEELSAWYFNQGRYQDGVDLLRGFAADHEPGLRLRMKTLQLACHAGDVRPADVELLMSSAHLHPGRAETVPSELDRLGSLVRGGACGSLTLSDLLEFLELHRESLSRSPQGRHAYQAARAVLALYARDYVIFRDSAFAAVRAHPNALYTLNTCSVFAGVRREDACACLKFGKHAFVGSQGIQKSLVRVLLGYPDELRYQYENITRGLCRPE